MMLSKITSGTALATVNAAGHDAAALATLEKGMKTGAINASGNGVPDKATVDGLVAAFTAQSAGASNWSVQRSKDRSTSTEVITASIVRELPSTAAAGRAAGTEARDVPPGAHVQCRHARRGDAGGMVAGASEACWWSAYDGQPATRLHGGGHRADGERHRSDDRTSSVRVRQAPPARRRAPPVPARTLTVSELFPGETVTFPFDELTGAARQSLFLAWSSADQGLTGTWGGDRIRRRNVVAGFRTRVRIE